MKRHAKSKTGGSIKIAGKTIRPNEDGQYVVTFDLIQRADLSKIPPGTEIVGDMAPSVYTAMDNYEYRLIKVLSATRVEVDLVHVSCEGAWNCALSLRKFLEIADELVGKPGEPEGLAEEGQLENWFHPFHFVVDNGPFRKIAQQAVDELARVLKPLWDFSARLDELTRKEFGV